MKDFLRLMRPVNAAMASLGTIVGGAISYQNVHAFYKIDLYLATLTVFLVLMAGNIMNDYFDIEVDKINHPKRPLPSGKISKETALILAIAFFALGYLISLLTFNWLLSMIVIFAIVLLLAYEWKAKKEGLIGNIIISFLVALIFIYGSLSLKFSYIILVFAFMAFLANLSREIIKDVEDVEGDIDRRTLPKKVGKFKSTMFAAIFLAVSISLSPIPFLYFNWNSIYIGIVTIADLSFLISMYLSFRNPSQGQQLIKIGMILGLLAFFVGGLL